MIMLIFSVKNKPKSKLKQNTFAQKHISIFNTKRLYQRQSISRKLRRQPRPLMKNYPSRKKEPPMVYKLGKDGAFDLTLGYLLAPATDTTQPALVIIIKIILAWTFLVCVLVLVYVQYLIMYPIRFHIIGILFYFRQKAANFSRITVTENDNLCKYSTLHISSIHIIITHINQCTYYKLNFTWVPNVILEIKLQSIKRVPFASWINELQYWPDLRIAGTVLLMLYKYNMIKHVSWKTQLKKNYICFLNISSHNVN